MKKANLHLVLSLIFSAAPILTYAEGRFEVIDYCPSSWTISSGIAGLNITKEGKDIVGSYIDANGREHGLKIRDGKCRRFDYPGADETQLGAMNDRGDLVGRTTYLSDYVWPDGHRDADHYGAFLYRKGKFFPLPTSIPYPPKEGTTVVPFPESPIGTPEYTFTQPTGITSDGLVLAHHRFDGTEWGEYLIRNRVVTLLPLPGVDGLQFTFAAGINDKRTIVGYRFNRFGQADPQGGFIISKGNVETIAYPGTDGRRTVFSGINNKNEIVGYNGRLDCPSPETEPCRELNEGFLYRNGNFKTIMFPGSISTAPTAISDKGSVVVGTFVTAEGAVKGFIYYPS